MFFTCSSCGGSFKKAQVESHLSFKCRSAQYMSCMDCSKDFWGNSYAGHTTCITEDQKYGGSNYVHKVPKGQQKQEDWVALIKKHSQAMIKKDSRLAPLFDKITKSTNLPKKEKQFKNFMKSSMGRIEAHKVDEIWKMLLEVKKEQAQSNKTETQQNTEKENKTETPLENKEKKRKLDDAETSSTEVVKKNKRERKEERSGKKKRVEEVELSEDLGNKLKKKSKKRKADLEDDNDEEMNKEELEVTKKSKKCKKSKHSAKDDENDSIGVDNVSMDEDDVLKKAKESPQEENGGIEGEFTKKSKKCKKRKHSTKEDKENCSNGIDNNLNTSGKLHNDILNGTNGRLNDTLVLSTPGPFKWKRTIEQVLDKASGQEMKLKKLEKKVVGQYFESGGENGHVKAKEEVKALFKKKLFKNTKFIVDHDVVRLRLEQV